MNTQPSTARRRESTLLTALITAVLFALTACTQTGPTPGAGVLAQGNDLSGQAYTVGGKEFTEQLVLCQITVLALRSAGADVTDSCGITGTVETRQALLDGTIDMYWEYNGTAWTTHLKMPDPNPDPITLYQQVRDKDLAMHNVVWLAQTPMSDSYSFAIDSDDAHRLNVQTISDMTRVLTAPGSTATVCLEPEFNERPDGWIPLQKTYNFTAPVDRTRVQELNSVYRAVDDDNQCTFGEVYATDGRIRSYGLTVLRDDLNALPKYNAALTLPRAVFDRNPAISRVIDPIALALDNATMTSLNAEVVGDQNRSPEDVARDWLRSKKFIT